MSAARFRAEMERAVAKAPKRLSALTLGVGTEVLDSIKHGSALTGAPGQPVDKGILKNSWRMRQQGPDVLTVSTNVEYAPDIEDGVGIHGPLTLRSRVGGFHSVRLTRAAFERILAAVLRRVKRNA